MLSSIKSILTPIKQKGLVESSIRKRVSLLAARRAGKVFIEYGPAGSGWSPISAPNYLLLNCFWVSGKYKNQGHGKALLQHVEKEAKRQK